MRVAAAIALSDETRLRLEKLARGRSTPVRIVQRSRIVLLAGDGLQNKEIAERMEVAPRMVALWRDRFLTLGVEGLLRDASRPGRTPSISTQTVTEIIEKTTQSKPANATHWSRSTMAREAGISESSVGRIWRSHGLKPHRVTSFKVSNDPLFADKLEAIVGLYLNPPEHALVLSVDEKSQIQALDRTQPGLPMKKGRGTTMTHDYKRNGTTTLFAALDVASGEVYGLCQQKHRHQEWLRFLRMIDQTVPADKDIYLICDNYSTHKHERVQRWLEKHKRFHVRFTPTSASWLNMVERFFRDLTENQLRRGVRTSVEALPTRIFAYSEEPNRRPKPIIWTAKANDILEKVKRAKANLNHSSSV
jgi:transposase